MVCLKFEEMRHYHLCHLKSRETLKFVQRLRAGIQTTGCQDVREPGAALLPGLLEGAREAEGQQGKPSGKWGLVRIRDPGASTCAAFAGYRALQGPKEVTGLEGDSVSVQCTYGDELRAHSKYWCREAGMFLSRCSGTIHAANDGSETTEGRVSIRDSPEERLFTVTLRALTPMDTGEYWCGARKLRSHKFFRVFVRVIPGREASWHKTGERR